jgi:hypothetical protein
LSYLINRKLKEHCNEVRVLDTTNMYQGKSEKVYVPSVWKMFTAGSLQKRLPHTEATLRRDRALFLIYNFKDSLKTSQERSFFIVPNERAIFHSSFTSFSFSFGIRICKRLLDTTEDFIFEKALKGRS